MWVAAWLRFRRARIMVMSNNVVIRVIGMALVFFIGMVCLFQRCLGSALAFIPIFFYSCSERMGSAIVPIFMVVVVITMMIPPVLVSGTSRAMSSLAGVRGTSSICILTTCVSRGSTVSCSHITTISTLD